MSNYKPLPEYIKDNPSYNGKRFSQRFSDGSISGEYLIVQHVYGWHITHIRNGKSVRISNSFS